MMKKVRLVRHSVTGDGKNSVASSKRGYGIAWVAGAFFAPDNIVKVASSPALRADETAKIYMHAAGQHVTTDNRITDAAFDQMPDPLPTGEAKADAVQRLKDIGKQDGLTVEEAIFHPDSCLLDFAAERGKNGFARLTALIDDIPDGKTMMVFSHGGMIEPIAITAKRTIEGNAHSTDSFSLDEIDGALWECEAYDITFNENNIPVEVKKVPLPDDFIELIKLAKKDRR